MRRRGRPVGDREARSGELIAAARSVIAREGYAGASLRKVAEAAGATTGALSYYFENKQAMVLAVAASLFDEFDAWLEAQGDACDPQSLCNNMLTWTTRGAGEAWLICLQLLVGARSERPPPTSTIRPRGSSSSAAALIGFHPTPTAAQL